jgi:hypothetical protein
MYYLELFDRRCRDFRYRYKFSTLELSVLSYVLRPHRVVVGRGVSSFKLELSVMSYVLPPHHVVVGRGVS